MIISLDKYKGGGEKPTEVLTQTITDNGSQTFNPQEGYVFSSAEITTDVHPTEALVATIDKNSTYHFIGEYNGADITTDIHPTEALITTISENGSHHFDGEYNGADITTDVHPTEKLITTISENGSHSFTGEYNGADITTDVHPTEALVTTINENGIRHFDGEYNGADITVAVETFTPTGNIDINANGSYDVANYATANVNVQVTTKNYSYFDGDVDTEGLRAIGWDDESIGMYRDNERHYASENNDYIVSEENKALNGVIVDKTTISNNKGNQNFKYCPFFDTSNVTDMTDMFKECTSLISIPKIDTSNVTKMNTMFYKCSSLTTIPQLDTSNVTNMSYMFRKCKPLITIPLLNTSKVTNMSYMFENCRSLTTIPSIDTSKVKDMSYMFDSCTSLTYISQLDTRNVTNMSNMFCYCRSLLSIPLLDTTKVTDMTNILLGCEALTYLGGFKNLHISVTSGFIENSVDLTVESLMNVINNLSKGNYLTLCFGSINLGKLTSEQIAIATNKGWTLTK